MAMPAQKLPPEIRVRRYRRANGHRRPLPAANAPATPPSRLGASSIWRDPVTRTPEASVRQVTSWPDGRRLFTDDVHQFSWWRIAAHVAVLAVLLGLAAWGATL